MGKGSQATGGYWYRPAFHIGLGARMDAFLGVTAAGKTAWSGNVTQSGYIHIEAPNLFGGQDDQGGISGDLQISFGEPTQQPDPYLKAVFSQRGLSIVNSQFWNQFLTDLKAGKPIAADLQDAQIPAWRGLATVSFRGGWYGANNPYPQKPSFLFRAIKVGWEGDVNWDGSACWYPEKAEVPVTAGGALAADATGWQYQILPDETDPGYENLAIPTSGWTENGQAPFAGGLLSGNTNWPIHTILWIKRTVTVAGKNQTLTVVAENGCVVFINGAIAGAVNRANADINNNQNNTFKFPVAAGQTYEIAVKGFDEKNSGSNSGTEISISISAEGLTGMNPAHILYYARTHSELGRDPVEAIDDASFRAGADWFYNQGIGFCTAYDPGNESVDDFTQRVGQVAGCSVNRSPIDGKWYLDIANGVYTLADLPILTDDDILDFAETPTTLDSAVNSVSAEYYDPIADATVMTPAAEAMSLIDSFGRNHQDIQYHEVPTAGLATRFTQRDLQAFTTPTRKFDLTTTRKPFAWRRNTYFRLQLRKRAIADMVCIIAGIESGTLKSGAMKLTVAQDTYSLPATSFVQVDPGIDTRPSPIPLAIMDQAAFEAPYTQVVGSLSRADLDALPADVGFLMTVAKDPATSRDYTITVSTDGGADYAGTAIGQFCPTALIVEGDPLTGTAVATAFTLSEGVALDSVAIGDAALWGREMCRVDALDAAANTVSLGRGCIDTIPQVHAANERIWFFDGFGGSDNVEYTDGESIDVELLTNTGSGQIDPSLTAPIGLTFDRRQARPYVPANLTINTLPWFAPGDHVVGTVGLAWANRDRVGQADQLLDYSQPGTGPEADATCTLRVYDADDALIDTIEGIGGESYDYAPPTDGTYTIEFESARNGLASWQKYAVTFDFVTVLKYLVAETGDPLVAEDGITQFIAE